MKKVLVFLAVALAVLLALFLLFGSVVVISPDVGRSMKIEGTTYLLVIRPSPLEAPFAHIGRELDSIVVGNLFNFLTFRGTDLPWYADRAYLSGHAFFGYNTKCGIVLDPKFFEGK